ncbi:MAG TPA: CmcJ/NvfI family oxidoreductase [Allosphingosinicella sp.]|nr:CmcJ/NvfI family oxidoreductase [Allosphingosinicella sp.]
MIRARLKGLMSPVSVTARVFYPGDRAPGPDFDPAAAPIGIGDARALQAEAASEAAFFATRGFVLLDHRPSPDWGESEAARPAIEAIVRERLFAGRRVEIARWLDPVHRGGGEDAVYADWVHQDFGLTADDFARNLAGIVDPEAARAWRERYDSADVTGCVAISFWRTLGLTQPLRHMPLALCDPGSVAMADVLPAAPAQAGDGNYHIALRFDAAQLWYHYPAMRSDELLAFKLFECRKDDPAPERLRSVFHTAFEDPAASADTERRRSCEHRLVVMLLAD